MEGGRRPPQVRSIVGRLQRPSDQIPCSYIRFVDAMIIAIMMAPQLPREGIGSSPAPVIVACTTVLLLRRKSRTWGCG